MSLASKVANLFSGSTNTQTHRNGFGFPEDGLSEGKDTFVDVKMGSEGLTSETMASKAIEEEGRSPYLHVGHPSTRIRSTTNLYSA